MQLSDFQALSFECHGTLIDKDSGVFNALRPLLGKGRITLERAEVLAAFAQCEAAQQAATPQQSHAGMLALVHQRLARDWGVVTVAEDHLLFGQSVAHWPLFVDAPAALQYLKRYFNLVIVTNADREVMASIKRQLLVRFDAVITAAEVGSCKSHAGHFDYMLAELASHRVAREHVLHVAAAGSDHHAAAAACGIDTACIDRYYQAREPAATVAGNSLFAFSSMVDLVRLHQQQLVA